MSISRKSKEAIKTALAITIAYGIALSLDWDSPKWAGIAVAMISLATVGQSLNKAALRMLGSFVGAGVALIIIALAAQERWNFIIIFATYIGFCTYMMSGQKHSYFWHVSGFVCAIICFSAGPNAENAFNITVLRLQETGLGILVYGVIAFLIWPSSSVHKLYETARKHVLTQRQQINKYFEYIANSASNQQMQALRMQESQLRTQLRALLDAAATDSYEIREVNHLWQVYLYKSGELVESLEQLRASFSIVRTTNTSQLLPSFESFCAEINDRLKQVEQMLAGKKSEREPISIPITFERNAVQNLVDSQNAALTLIHSQLESLDGLTKDLFYIVKDIKYHKRTKKQENNSDQFKSVFVLDTDRLACATRIMVITFLAFLSVIYIDGMPADYTVVIVTTIFGMMVSSMPQLSVWVMLTPALLSILFAGVLYIFVMPQISSYAELGPLIFGVTFFICYLFATPKQALGRVFGLAMFIVVTGIDNQQSYSFLSVANTALVYPIAFIIIATTLYLPISWIPKYVFLRLLRRYFGSSAYVVSSSMKLPQKENTFLAKYKNTFYVNEVNKLPRKMNSWVKHVADNEQYGATKEQMQALVNSLELLSLHLLNLQNLRINIPALNLSQEQQHDLHLWVQKVLVIFEKLSVENYVTSCGASGIHLDEKLQNLHNHLEKVLNNNDIGQLGRQDTNKYYLLLGYMLSVSAALNDYTDIVESINWVQWYETRFA